MHSARSWITATLLFVTILPALAVVGPKRSGGYDIRADASEKSRTILESYRAGLARKDAAVEAGIAAAQAKLNAAVPHLQVEVNPLTKTPEIVGLGTAAGAVIRGLARFYIPPPLGAVEATPPACFSWWAANSRNVLAESVFNCASRLQ